MIYFVLLHDALYYIRLNVEFIKVIKQKTNIF